MAVIRRKADDIETYPEYFCKIYMKKYKKMIENNMEKK